MQSRDFRIICWVLLYGSLSPLSRVLTSVIPAQQPDWHLAAAILTAAFAIAATIAIVKMRSIRAFALELPTRGKGKAQSGRSSAASWLPLFAAALLLPALNIVLLLTGQASATTDALTLVLLACGAYLEELLFRGYMLQSLLMRTRITEMGCIVATSVLFAMLHLANATDASLMDAIVQTAYAFLVGIVLAVLTNRSKSILPACAIHVFNNLISLNTSAIFVKLPSIIVAGCVAAFAIYLAKKSI